MNINFDAFFVDFIESSSFEIFHFKGSSTLNLQRVYPSSYFFEFISFSIFTENLIEIQRTFEFPKFVKQPKLWKWNVRSKLKAREKLIAFWVVNVVFAQIDGCIELAIVAIWGQKFHQKVNSQSLNIKSAKWTVKTKENSRNCKRKLFSLFSSLFAIQVLFNVAHFIFSHNTCLDTWKYFFFPFLIHFPW